MWCQAGSSRGGLVLHSSCNQCMGSCAAHANSAPAQPEDCSGHSQMAFSLFCSTQWRKSSPAIAASVCWSKRAVEWCQHRQLQAGGRRREPAAVGRRSGGRQGHEWARCVASDGV